MNCGKAGRVDDRPRGAGRAHNDVGLCHPAVEFVERPSRAAPIRRQTPGPLEAAIDDNDLADSFVFEITERLLGHFAGADHDHCLVVEAVKNALAEVTDCHARNGDTSRGQFRLMANAGRDAEGSLKQRIRKRPARVVVYAMR